MNSQIFSATGSVTGDIILVGPLMENEIDICGQLATDAAKQTSFLIEATLLDL